MQSFRKCTLHQASWDAVALQVSFSTVSSESYRSIESEGQSATNATIITPECQCSCSPSHVAV